MNTNTREMAKAALTKEFIHTDDLPALDLYIDQVLTLIERGCSSGHGGPDEKPLTKMMVNNYSKAGLISPVKGKKYSREHITQMLTICALKGTLSISEIKSVMDTLYIDNEFSAGELFGSYEKSFMAQSKAREALSRLLDEPDILDDKNISELFSSLMAVCAMSDALKELAKRIVSEYFTPKEDKRPKK